jgi:hypothetical protein
MTLRAFRLIAIPLGILAAAWVVLFWSQAGRAPEYTSLKALEVAIVISAFGAPLAVAWRFPRMLDRQAARRAIIVIGYGGLTWYAVAWAVVSASLTAESVASLHYALAGLAFGALSLLMLLAWYRREKSLRPDERTMVRDNRTLSIAFQVMALACGAELLLWSLWVPARSALAGFVATANIVLAMTLPAAVDAWSRSDVEVE